MAMVTKCKVCKEEYANIYSPEESTCFGCSQEQSANRGELKKHNCMLKISVRTVLGDKALHTSMLPLGDVDKAEAIEIVRNVLRANGV